MIVIAGSTLVKVLKVMSANLRETLDGEYTLSYRTGQVCPGFKNPAGSKT